MKVTKSERSESYPPISATTTGVYHDNILSCNTHVLPFQKYIEVMKQSLPSSLTIPSCPSDEYGSKATSV